METMTVNVEVWPVAADRAGIWLLSGDEPWCPALPVMAADSIHGEVELLLADHGLGEIPAGMIHSTSWRPMGPQVLLTYLVVVDVPGDVRSRFPSARPVGLALAAAVGKPRPHAPTDEPMPRDVDVLMNGLRHLLFQMDTNPDNAAAMGGYWRTHLNILQPTLAGLYTSDDQAA